MTTMRRQQLMKALLFQPAQQHSQRKIATNPKLQSNSYYAIPLDDIEKSCNDIRKPCKVKLGCLKEAVDNLHFTDNQADSRTYTALLHACIKKNDLPYGKLICSHMNQTGFRGDVMLHNTLVNMYVKCGSLVDARRAFNQMSERDVCSWTVMIAAYSKHGFPEEALELFQQMPSTGVKPNHFTFASVLPACAQLASLDQGTKIHEEIKRRGFESNAFVANALVDMYAKCDRVETARTVFDKMSEPNVVSWTALIAGYAQKGDIDEAAKLFQKMPHRDVFSWTAMIAGYAQNGWVEDALRVFGKMRLAGISPDAKTFASVLPACADSVAIELGMQIHGAVIKSGFQSSVFVVSALVNMYTKCGNIERARELFNKMRDRDVVSWSIMIAGHVQIGLVGEALKLFEQMQSAGLTPNSQTFASILPACANLAALEQGMQIHGKIIKSGAQSDVTAVNALIDMYSKCGNIENARDLFDKMHRRNVVSWTAMIAGYAMHGCGNDALLLFEQMKRSCSIPDHVTYLCVLSACSHAGLVDQGYEHFNCMSEHHHITPAMEHYSCMVDLLCRAGRLYEAQDFINKMPIQPDDRVWTCLLSACKVHNDLKLGEYVADRLLELNPINDAPYVLISNIYAAVGRRDDIERVRKKMKDRGLKKSPGCSWIEVNKRVHAFLIGHRSQFTVTDQI